MIYCKIMDNCKIDTDEHFTTVFAKIIAFMDCETSVKFSFMSDMT